MNLIKQNKMKLIIAGCRDITNFNTLIKALHHHNIKREDIQEIVSGNARGADRLGEMLAEKYNIPLKLFPANWDKYGKSAGPIRNNEMSVYADSLLALWDNKSRGTKHMIETMHDKNKKVFVYIDNTNN